MNTPKSPQDRSKSTLIKATIFYFFSLGPAICYAFFLLLAANGVVSDTEPCLLPWKLTMLLLLAYPIVIVVCLLLAWYLYRRKKFQGAFIIALLPPIQISLSLILGVISFISISSCY